MATANATVRINKLPKMVLEVKAVITKEFRFRMWTAKRLIRLAAWILGGRAEIDAQVRKGSAGIG